jgi:hypothetical protein
VLRNRHGDIPRKAKLIFPSHICTNYPNRLLAMTSRTPCKFFQQGNCFKGNNCKFAHIKSGGTGQWGGNNSFGTPAANDAIKYKYVTHGNAE